VKEFKELAMTEIGAPAAPLMIVADAGVTLNEKSGAGAAPWTVRVNVAE
jgi:hypothetical protein